MFKTFKTFRTFATAAALIALGSVGVRAATTRYVELRSTLQPNTTGLNAIFVSSGTILNFRASTATITGPLTVSGTLTPTMIAGTITDTSTTTYSGAHTFSSATLTAATIGTLSGTRTDNSTATYSGGQTFSTMTVTDARFLAMTVSGAIKDRTLSTGTTWDYLLGGSSSTWSHAGLILQSTQSVVATSSATAGSVFIPSNMKVVITPKFATSIIKVSVLYQQGTSNGAGDSCQVTLERNATNLATGANYFGIGVFPTGVVSYNAPITYMDSPASTSALTYQVYFKTSAGGATCTLNGNSSGVILAEEIGQ